ncbi:rod shape-determining protein [Patescibacteria group bacterium]|nr:rod shape-determining protein [Patescibacteria group bacterium]
MLKNLFSFKLIGDSLGMDLGTANTLIYKKGKGIVLDLPSVIAVSKKSNKVLSIGDEAKRMLGKTPQNILAIRPMQDGVIADFDITRKMVECFLLRVQPQRAIIGPKLIIGVPSRATKVEKRALVDIAKELGARKVYLVAEAVAAAIGADLPISEPLGNMIVDIGGGTSESAIVSLNGVVVSKSTRIAGDEMNQAIVQYIKEEYKLYIGDGVAEQMKIDVGCIYPSSENKKIKVRGRDLNSGFPSEAEIDLEEINVIFISVLSSIVDIIEETLEECPPELASDIMKNGIHLSGGGACLKDLDRYISERAHLPVKLVPKPLFSVTLGLGKLLDDRDLLSTVEITPNLK